MKLRYILVLYLVFTKIVLASDFSQSLDLFAEAIKFSKTNPQKANIYIEKVLSLHNPIIQNDALVVYAYLNQNKIKDIIYKIDRSKLTRGFVYEYYRLLAKEDPSIMNEKPCFFQDKENLLEGDTKAIKNALKYGCYYFAYQISKNNNSLYAKQAVFFHYLFNNKFNDAYDTLSSLQQYPQIYEKLKNEYEVFVYKYLYFNDKPQEVIAYARYIPNGFHKYFYQGISYYELGDMKNAKISFLKASKYDKNGASYYWLYKTTKNKIYLNKASHYNDFYGTKAKLRLGKPIKTHFLRCKYYKITPSVRRFKQILNTGFNAYTIEYYKDKHFTNKELCAIFHMDPKFYILKEKDYDAYPIAFLRYIPKDTNPYLVLSIIRRESFYNPIARTYWAFPIKEPTTVGLMQVKESTAQFVANKYNLDFDPDMTNPKNSILYGSYYLKFLYNMFNHNLIKTIASYNAGPGNVNKYKDFKDEMLFIEHIPNYINRTYVKKVLNAYWHYKYGK